jgi:hypothetical protein
MLSHAVLSVMQVFSSLWCWVWLVEYWEYWSSTRRDMRSPWWGSMLWFEQARFGMVEMVGIRQVMCFVMLESAKNWVIAVDAPGQHVPLCVQYGTTCLLIRDVLESVPCSNEWEVDVVTLLGSHGARGAVIPWLPWETLALLWCCDYLS